MQDDDGLLGDMKFDDELEGFFNGTGGTVNLQPMPKGTIGAVSEEGSPAPEVVGAAGAEAPAGASGVAAAAAAAAATILGPRLGVAQGLLSSLFSNAAEKVAGSTGASLPGSLGPVKDTASSFLSKAQPWREFVWPLSVPSANEGCSRITANIYNFQTNYAILFVVQLVLSIIMEPHALICIIVTVVAWVLFLKKNDDPEWQPKVGGVVLSPMQRWMALAATTALVLLLWVGGAIINAVFMYLLFALAHGLLHDPSAKGIPGGGEPIPI
eukprot:TRINITY_DN585_c0_g1_i1.p1 TRINITY_DN585_c0_g1~~TRINITY_DN585_c0_g1_i1.p1  ORF type:complete len:269 (+),score=61.40 TRINITY_DN585_c0_g1_i1:124-930(+)